MNPFVQQAKERYANGYNCAQAVASPFFEKYDISDDLGMRITAGMGGGYRTGEICGAAAGGVFVVGVGTKDPEEIGDKTKEFLERFRDIEGNLSCQKILNATPAERAVKTEEEREADRTICRNLCKEAAEILVDMGY